MQIIYPLYAYRIQCVYNLYVKYESPDQSDLVPSSPLLTQEPFSLVARWQYLKGNRYIFRGGSSDKRVLCVLEKGSTLKGKNLLPEGSKFLPFRVDPFPEGI